MAGQHPSSEKLRPCSSGDSSPNPWGHKSNQGAPPPDGQVPILWGSSFASKFGWCPPLFFISPGVVPAVTNSILPHHVSPSVSLTNSPHSLHLNNQYFPDWSWTDASSSRTYWSYVIKYYSISICRKCDFKKIFSHTFIVTFSMSIVLFCLNESLRQHCWLLFFKQVY